MEIDLKIVCGRDLPICDIYTSDPYIKFEIDGTKYKTDVKTNTLNPDWYDKYKVRVKEGEEIEFKFYDRDIVGKDDDMGKCKWTGDEIVSHSAIKVER